ncbi:hypothetical protein EAG_15812 [Camponotus floridanus]|uniref:Uncharacterized protein n=1 Tax=Camponotus floridanus TaxID=104421 RepID=E2AUG0_CAMFO|nr:hypothetical protein EAG_15812 [Camponotus floridanus]
MARSAVLNRGILLVTLSLRWGSRRVEEGGLTPMTCLDPTRIVKTIMSYIVYEYTTSQNKRNWIPPQSDVSNCINSLFFSYHPREKVKKDRELVLFITCVSKMCVRVQISIKLLDAEKSKGALSDLKSITTNLYRKIGSLQMDHPCFLLRAYAQDTWHNKRNLIPSQSIILSQLPVIAEDSHFETPYPGYVVHGWLKSRRSCVSGFERKARNNNLQMHQVVSFSHLKSRSSNFEETKTQSIYATNVIIALSKSSNNQMKAFRPDPDERLNEVHPNYQQLSGLQYNSVSDTEVGKGAAKSIPPKGSRLLNEINVNDNPIDDVVTVSPQKENYYVDNNNFVHSN